MSYFNELCPRSGLARNMCNCTDCCSFREEGSRREREYEKEKWAARNTVQEKYNELIYAVREKFENESRHETALRYIRQAENKVDNTAVENSDKLTGGGRNG